MSRDDAIRKLKEGQRLRQEGDRLIDEAVTELQAPVRPRRVRGERPQPAQLTDEQKAKLERTLRKFGVAS